MVNSGKMFLEHDAGPAVGTRIRCLTPYGLGACGRLQMPWKLHSGDRMCREHGLFLRSEVPLHCHAK